MRPSHLVSFIVCERDIDCPFRSTGAIIFEQYTRLEVEEVQEHAQRLADGGKYGRVWLGILNADKLQEIRPKLSVPK